MILVNFVGIALSIVYLMIYFQYSPRKLQAWAKMGLGGAFTAALVGYAHYEDPKLVEYRFGMMLTAFMFWLIASPLFNLVSRHYLSLQATLYQSIFDELRGVVNLNHQVILENQLFNASFRASGNIF